MRIEVTIDAIANMDDVTLSSRMENFIDPDDLNKQLLGKEAITFLGTDISVRSTDISVRKRGEQ